MGGFAAFLTLVLCARGRRSIACASVLSALKAGLGHCGGTADSCSPANNMWLAGGCRVIRVVGSPLTSINPKLLYIKPVSTGFNQPQALNLLNPT